jgi:hypothetical protein
MGVRGVKYELEAKLRPAVSYVPKPNGRVERKSYGDGGERLKIVVRKIKAPDGTLAIIKVGGVEVAQLPLEQGFARSDEESFDMDALPTLKTGQKVEVFANNVLFLEGELCED